MLGDNSFIKDIAIFLSSLPWVVFCCFFISFWALFVRVSIFFHLQAVRKDLVSAMSFLSSQDKGSWIDKLKNLGMKIRRLPSLYLPWLAFQEKLAQCFQKIPSKNMPDETASPTQGRVLLRTPLVEEYFNCAILLQKKISWVQLSSFPQFFMRLGLLATFIALASGLYLIHYNLIDGVLTSVEFVLVEILSLFSLTLCSSITGLLVSLWISSWLRKEYKKFEQDINDWNRKLKSIIPPASEDKWQVMQVTESQKQTEHLVTIKQSLKENHQFFQQQNHEFIKAFLLELRRDLIGEFKASLETMNKQSLMIHSRSESLSPLLSGMTKVSEDILNSQEQQKEHLAQFLKIGQSLELASKNIEIVHKNTCEDLKYQAVRAIEIDKKLDTVFAKSHRNLEAYALKLNQYTSALDKQTAQGLRFFAQAIGSLNILLKKIPKSTALIISKSKEKKETTKKKSISAPKN